MRTITSALLFSFLIWSPLARAADKAPHPAYLTTLSDLRFARGLIEHRGGSVKVLEDEVKAIHEIDAAIKEIKAAAIDDGKKLNEHPPIDGGLEHKSALQRAHTLLHASFDRMAKAEDNTAAKGMKDRANIHIEAAMKATERAIKGI
jgi:hypothetical protein